MERGLAAKPPFANGALRFAERAPRRLRWTALVVVGALVVAVAGPFGTIAMPFAPRAGFWLTVMLWNFAKWEMWFTVLMRRGLSWRLALPLGLPIVPLPLPLEVDLGLRIFAGASIDSPFEVWLRGAAIAGLMLMAIVLLPLRRAPPATRGETRFPGTAIRCGEIAALVAEDHYVRLHLADGSSRLLLIRFGDAVAAMADEPGETLGRGAWLADRYRGPAEYRNRRWFVQAEGDLWLPVSRSKVAPLRERGWLAREG